MYVCVCADALWLLSLAAMLALYAIIMLPYIYTFEL